MSEQIQHGTTSITLQGSLERIPQLINKDDVVQMIKTQEATLDRLECTNKSLVNCSKMAQDKLATTSKLYKKTAKQLAESKRDLDVIYKKILDMKGKLKSERPDLFRGSSLEEDELQNVVRIAQVPSEGVQQTREQS